MAVIDGVASSRFPYLPIRLEIRLQEFETEALLDTEFDGDVIVPSGWIESRFPPDGQVRWTLADGSSVLDPYHVGTLQAGVLPSVPIIATTLGEETLVGVGVVEHFAVTLDHGRRVVVQP
jgi:hypothetical protein